MRRPATATVLAHFLGYALTSDAHHATSTRIRPASGAHRAMRRVLEQLNLTPGRRRTTSTATARVPRPMTARSRRRSTAWPAAARRRRSAARSRKIGHMLRRAAGAIEAAVCTLVAARQEAGRRPSTFDPAFPPTRDIVPESRKHETNVVLSNYVRVRRQTTSAHRAWTGADRPAPAYRPTGRHHRDRVVSPARQPQGPIRLRIAYGGTCHAIDPAQGP